MAAMRQCWQGQLQRQWILPGLKRKRVESLSTPTGAAEDSEDPTEEEWAEDSKCNATERASSCAVGCNATERASCWPIATSILSEAAKDPEQNFPKAAEENCPEAADEGVNRVKGILKDPSAPRSTSGRRIHWARHAREVTGVGREPQERDTITDSFSEQEELQAAVDEVEIHRIRSQADELEIYRIRAAAADEVIRAAWALTPTPTRPATEQTPEIPADAEATMQDSGNASILRCSDFAVAPDAATEHIAPQICQPKAKKMPRLTSTSTTTQSVHVNHVLLAAKAKAKSKPKAKPMPRRPSAPSRPLSYPIYRSAVPGFPSYDQLNGMPEQDFNRAVMLMWDAWAFRTARAMEAPMAPTTSP